MPKRFVAWIIGACAAASASATPDSPVDRFIVDEEFCAYMASPPENDSEEFLVRYEAAMRTAVAFILQRDPESTETKALFLMKEKCDVALNDLAHYR